MTSKTGCLHGNRLKMKILYLVCMIFLSLHSVISFLISKYPSFHRNIHQKLFFPQLLTKRSSNVIQNPYSRFYVKPLSSDFINGLSDAMVQPETSFPLTIGVFSLVGLFGIIKLGIYWFMQLKTAELLSGIPKNLNIVEVDAMDGKNIFYLPSGSDYTAVMKSIKGDVKKQEEKAKLDEQLILECIGKANREGANLKGKVRTSISSIPTSNADCVISVGALKRTEAFPVFTLQECYRILRPGGLFVFIEPDPNNNLIDQIKQVFPETMKVKPAKESPDLRANLKKEKSDKKRKKKNDRNEDRVETVVQLMEENRTENNESSLVPTVNNDINIDDEGDNSSTALTKNSRLRPGVIYERLSNFNIDPYISGVAVKPY